MILIFSLLNFNLTKVLLRNGIFRMLFTDFDENSFSTKKSLKFILNVTNQSALNSREKKTWKILLLWLKSIIKNSNTLLTLKMKGWRNINLLKIGKKGKYQLLNIWCGWILQEEEATMICLSIMFFLGFLMSLLWNIIRETLLTKIKSQFRIMKGISRMKKKQI